MKQLGMTLIELMIVLLIIGLLAVAASPFTSAWVKDSQVSTGASTLEQAFGRAKTVAMRNNAQIVGDAPASMLCFSAAKVSLLVPASATQVLTCDLSPAWSGSIADIVTIKDSASGLDWSCSCFSNKGVPTKAGVCNICSDSLKFDISYPGADDSESQRSFY